MSHTEFKNSAVAQKQPAFRDHAATIIFSLVIAAGLVFAFARAIDLAI